ncbi:transposase [Desulfosediminicola sp.]|uniref:transposase n=1 Tax=Desulfosediminicola sp. TaxID=2886825 RepID=UPI003AF2AEEA
MELCIFTIFTLPTWRRHEHKRHHGTGPGIAATSGSGKITVQEFRTFLESKCGSACNVTEVVCGMSPFIFSCIEDELAHSQVTFDWFYIVPQFVKADDDTRKLGNRRIGLPKASVFAVQKGRNNRLSSQQVDALHTLLENKRETATARQIKEPLAWIKNNESIKQAEERIDLFIEKAALLSEDLQYTDSVKSALATLEKHGSQVIQRWTSTSQMPGLRASYPISGCSKFGKGYRNNEAFIARIYMIASP